MTKLGMVVLFVLSHKFIICLHLFSSGSWKIIGIIDLVRKTVIYKYLWLPSLQHEWLALPNLRAHAQVSLLRKYLYITRCLIGSIWPSLPNRTLWSARPSARFTWTCPLIARTCKGGASRKNVERRLRSRRWRVWHWNALQRRSRPVFSALYLNG